MKTRTTINKDQFSHIEYIDGKLYNKLTKKELGHLDNYYRIKINKIVYQLHNVIWYLFNNKWPDGIIDHINGNKLDNRIENLRDVTQKINCKNQKLRKTNKTGYSGISKTKSNTFVICIMNEGKKYSKTFKTLEEARINSVEKYIEFGFDYNHYKNNLI